MTSHPSIAQLKIAVWKLVYHYLSPVSKSCPPNACVILTYFRKFNGKINPHKDMNPNMAVDPKINSQIAGSNVVTVSLFSDQYFQFVQKVHNGKTKKYEVVSQFLTNHCSVYSMDPDDDQIYYHRTKWPRKKHNNCTDNVRISMTFRWLGKRSKFLGNDYNGRSGQRANTEAVFAPRKIVENFKSNEKKKAYKEILKRTENK